MPDGWRSTRTCGPASVWSAAVQAPRWSVRMRRSPTGSPNTRSWAWTTSSCPVIRTSRRPTSSARGCVRSWPGGVCWAPRRAGQAERAGPLGVPAERRRRQCLLAQRIPAALAGRESDRRHTYAIGWRTAATRRTVLVASLVGTTVEWYDFFLYATAATLVFNHEFFPSQNSTRRALCLRSPRSPSGS